MCAIFGIIGEYDETQAKNALAKLTHRGPDYCGIEQSENLFFAHQRLSITDAHARAHQPLKHHKILLSFNDAFECREFMIFYVRKLSSLLKNH